MVSRTKQSVLVSGYAREISDKFKLLIPNEIIDITSLYLIFKANIYKMDDVNEISSFGTISPDIKKFYINCYSYFAIGNDNKLYVRGEQLS